MKYEVAEIVHIASTSSCFELLVALNSADGLTTHSVSQRFSMVHLPHEKARHLD